MTLKVRVRLLIFAVITAVAVVYAGFQYVGLGSLFGVHGSVVTVQLADSGGIFVNAEVTYRGVTVGRVGTMRVAGSGIAVQLDLDPSAPKIPASSRAVVADRSAVGEQYIDLEPTTGAGPYLTDGSVIPQRRTATPMAPQTLLTDLDQLATSVPAGSLHTVIGQLGIAFGNTGPALSTLLDATDSLTQSAVQHLPQTDSLLDDANTVLATQQAEASQITSFSTSLNLLAGQLKQSDPTIRSLISELPPVAQQIDDLLRRSGTDMGVVLANLLTTAQITETRTKAITQMLVEWPYAVAAQSSTNPGGVPRLGFVLDFFDPMPCTNGYNTTERPGGDVTPKAPDEQAYCAEPASSGIDVRGANNAPFGGMPVESTPAQPAESAAPQGNLLGNASTGPTTLATLLGIG
ncbi:MAG TPA: MlaD family protein [Pseudonocardiaceae bacterium]|nr:MlaD family protein [Pseudonocardiaceae bacterium]